MEFTAFMIGFVGSLHCVAMCSPLSMAATKLTSQAFLNRLNYNTGRILTYAILGALFSAVGYAIQLSSFQYLVTISFGVILITFGFFTTSKMNLPVAKSLHPLVLFIKGRISKLFLHKSRASVFALGMVNGILPCGLSFAALSYCIILRGPLDGFLFMIFFGMGTLPAMLGGAAAIQYLISRFQLRPRYINSGIMIAAGIFVLARVFWVVTEQSQLTGETMADIVLCR